MDIDSLKGLIGKEIDVIIDRPIGTTHPKYKEMIYLVNYAYTDGFYGGDNEYQDVYILGEGKPLNNYRGKVIAIVHRLNDNEDKLVVHNYGYLSSNEIEEAINFQEKYFKHEIITLISCRCNGVQCIQSVVCRHIESIGLIR